VVVDLSPSLPQVEYLSSEPELKKRNQNSPIRSPSRFFFHLYTVTVGVTLFAHTTIGRLVTIDFTSPARVPIDHS
jgi:hypothetical protein